MITVHYCEGAEFREKATQIVLETLACLPETLRKIFVWSHYRGCSVNQIAGMLDWRAPEIEAALYAISSTLYRRTRGLLVQDSGVHSSGNGIRQRKEQDQRTAALRSGCPTLLDRRDRVPIKVARQLPSGLKR